MKLVRRLQDYTPDKPLALAIGNFDGLHRGHKAVLARMREIAKKENLTPAVLTFEPHPRRHFAPQAPAFRLQRLRDKLAGLRDLGTDYVFALKFDADFAARSAESFLDDILRKGMNTRAVITGENFAFGKGRGGDVALLKKWSAQHHIRTEQVSPVLAEGDICSSSAVRQALERGDMRHTAALLGESYRISGRVRHGDRRGHQLGYPTANILPPFMLKLPRHGIYAARVCVGGQWYKAVASLGVRPTIAPGGEVLLEAHLFDYAGDLYGQRLEVELLAHLRDEKRFDSLAALTHQIAQDARDARAFLAGASHG